MKFRRKVTDSEISEFQQNIVRVADKIEWWWVTVTEDDMKNNIHVYHNGKFNRNPYGWQYLSTETCLGKYSKKVLEVNFKEPHSSLEPHFKNIKEISQNIDFDKLTETLWAYVCYRKEGPYMIVDGVHRQIGTFINHFLYKKNNFFPFEKSICGICLTETKNTDIPNHFCGY